MRKNLITLITLALVLVNLVLTVIMTIAIMPEINKVNELVGKVSNAINLDISSSAGEGSSNVSLDSIQVVSLADTMTINLKDSGDGKDHMAILGIALSVNLQSDLIETYPDVASYEPIVRSTVNSVVSQYTIDDMKDNQDEVLSDICETLNSQFGGDLIANVGFSTATFQ